jgi:hypothetical protein
MEVSDDARRCLWGGPDHLRNVKQKRNEGGIQRSSIRYAKQRAELFLLTRSSWYLRGPSQRGQWLSAHCSSQSQHSEGLETGRGSMI